MENNLIYINVKLKTELPYDPAISLLGIYLKNTKTLIWKDIHTSMFIATLFTITKIWKQPMILSVDEWIKMWHTHTHIYTYIYIYIHTVYNPYIIIQYIIHIYIHSI